MWVIWITTALAHSPHDVATVLDIEGLLLLSNDSDILALSEDGGRSYSYEGWLGDVPACAWLVEMGAAVADPDLGLWIWDGQEFAPTAVEEGVLACARGRSGRLLAATASGLWSSEDGLSWSLVEEGGSWGRVELWEEGWLVDAEGALLQRTVEGWAPADVEGVLALALWEGELWVGTEAGLLRGGEEGLFEVAGAPAGLRVLHAGAWGLWGATAEEGGWHTGDGLLWEQRAEGLDPLAEGGGGPHDGIHYFCYAEEGEALWFGTFEGLYRWSEERQVWIQAALDTVPRVRSTAWLADGRLLVGAYGGGVYRGRPGNVDWAEISAGVGWPWPKQVIAADGEGEELWVVSGSALYHSVDAGSSWETARVGLTEAGDMVVLHPDWPARPVVVVAGHDSEGRGAVARSDDGGRRWTSAALPGDCPNKPRALSWGEGLWLACGVHGGLYSSEDEGLSWSEVDRLGSEILSMDLGADGSLWLGTEAGLVSRSASGRPTRVGEDVPVLAVRALRDGGLIWAEAGGLHRLEAGGGLPEALG
jgi:ligand-binding sensor domain-containing protein